MLDIDQPGDDGLFGLRYLKTAGYEGASGDASLDLLGFDVEVVSKTRLKFWMVNNRSAVDKDRRFLDSKKVGGNATIDVFEVTRGSDEMTFINSFTNEAIVSLNKVAATGDGNLVFTNDRTSKHKSLIDIYYMRNLMLHNWSCSCCNWQIVIHS